jgi:uncharacterized membrane protein YidH (DUF202 family)
LIPWTCGYDTHPAKDNGDLPYTHVSLTPRPDLGRLIVAIGVGVALLGLVVWSGALSWFGRLPGDIRIERDNVRVYIPVVSMLLASVVVSLVVQAVRRWL